MQLREFRVHMYKGIVDSGPISVDPLTVLVGKNESGKTSILEALHKLNPATPKPYQIDHEWPRGRRRDRRKDRVVCSAIFQLEPEEIEELKKLTDQNATLESIEVTRTYEGHLNFLHQVVPAHHRAGPRPDCSGPLQSNSINMMCDLGQSGGAWGPASHSALRARDFWRLDGWPRDCRLDTP
jgi:hypothetical protein